MCYKAVYRCFFVFGSIPYQYKNQELCDIVSLYHFWSVYCPDKCKTQGIFDEAADDFLAAVKLIPDWSVTSKMIKKLYTALYADYGLFFFDEDSVDVTFCCNEMDILSVNCNNINLDINFDGDNSDTITLIRLLAWYSQFKKHKTLNSNSMASQKIIKVLCLYVRRWKRKRNRNNFH